MAPFEAKFLNVNTNALGDGPSKSSTDSGEATIYVVPNSGSHSNHVIDIQISPNGGDSWVTIGSIAGVGYATFHGNNGINADEWRLKVTTVEGSASTVNAYIIGR